MTDGLVVRAEGAALVAVGGFAGANARYLVDGVAPGLGGTLAVNVAGSLLLGVLFYESLYTDLLAGRSRTTLGTGFLASFTTYSTFVVETLRAPGLWPVAGVVATYALGFAGALVGRAVARAATGGRP